MSGPPMLTRLRCTTSRGAVRGAQLRVADDALERVALRFGGSTGDAALDELSRLAYAVDAVVDRIAPSPALAAPAPTVPRSRRRVARALVSAGLVATGLVAGGGIAFAARPHHAASIAAQLGASTTASAESTALLDHADALLRTLPKATPAQKPAVITQAGADLAHVRALLPTVNTSERAGENSRLSALTAQVGVAHRLASAPVAAPSTQSYAAPSNRAPGSHKAGAQTPTATTPTGSTPDAGGKAPSSQFALNPATRLGQSPGGHGVRAPRSGR
jgi:hypothetical protein